MITDTGPSHPATAPAVDATIVQPGYRTTDDVRMLRERGGFLDVLVTSELAAMRLLDLERQR